MSDYPEFTAGSVLINDMPDDERPREKALRHGIKSLSDAELMAIIFSTGIKGLSVVDLSRLILKSREGHLSLIARMSVAEFCNEFKGIGPAKALTLLAGLELGSRATEDAVKLTMKRKPITSPEDIRKLMGAELGNLPHEEFWVLYLNQAGKLIKKVQIGRGGITATAVDVRLILREALLATASAMILVHNHPSGNLQPSRQDIALTEKTARAAKYHDIRVNDHLIFTDTGYYSFHNEGMIPVV